MGRVRSAQNRSREQRRGAQFVLRQELSESLKEAMKAKDRCATSTIRLILAALKDRDIAARTQGSDEKLSDDRIATSPPAPRDRMRS